MKANTLMKTQLIDNRTALILKGGKPYFRAISILPAFPPDQRAQLFNGFRTVEALKAYCASWGIALFRCAT